MPADYSRIHRLLKILTLIQAKPGWTAEKLAKECGVTLRTIYRDMKALEGAGIPYFHDTENPGYRVRRDFFMPPVQLTLDESLALVALAEHIGGKEQVPMMRSAGRAVAKVRSLLPLSLRDQLDRLDNHVQIKLAASGPTEGVQDVYDHVRKAISTRRALLCAYESPGKTVNGSRPFAFEPYTLFFGQRAWYTYGRHSKHKEVRCLKLSRFTSVALTDHPYRVPKTFRVEDHLGLAWRMVRGEKRYDVEMRFDPQFAETIADTHWHSTQEIEWNPDRSITFRCQVDGLDEIVWWVLGMGPHCKVQAPGELAKRVAELAQTTHSLYKQK